MSEHYPIPTQYLFLTMSHSTEFATAIKDLMYEFKATVK